MICFCVIEVEYFVFLQLFVTLLKTMAQKPRGRGAILQEILKKHKEAQVGEPGPAPIPPKSTGRAALLQKIQQMKDKKAGELESSAKSETSIAGPSTSEPRRDAMEAVTKEVAEMSVTTAEPCSYQGGFLILTQIKMLW